MSVSSVLLNRFFTPSSINKLIFEHEAALYRQLLKKLPAISTTSNSEAISDIYGTLSRNHRNEYYYKNTLLNKILLGRHSLRTSVAIRELPIAGSILDFLIINGIGQVYEIKTGLDNLERLPNQLTSYYQAFKYVNVVTDNCHLDVVYNSLRNMPVGIMVLTSRQTLHIVREPIVDESMLNHEAIFKILRKGEYETILLKYFHELPRVSQIRYFRACFDLFVMLDINICHEEMLHMLKARNKVCQYADDFNQVPRALKEIVYFSDYQEAHYTRLFEFLTDKVYMG